MTDVSGRLAQWDAEHGWGVIESASTPGGCWFHYTMLVGLPEEEVAVGERYDFTFEPAEQDGFSYRALRVGRVGSDLAPTGHDGRDRSGTAFGSELRLHLD